MAISKILFFAALSLNFSVGFLQAELTDYGAVPQFNLTDQNGRAVTLQNMKGRVFIADFIFTRCQGPCPVLTRQMASLQKKLPARIYFLTVTVDPEYDNASVLNAYAAQVSADPQRWLFLTGEKQQIHSFIQDGFHLNALQNDQAKSVGESVLHSLRFVLIDAQGNIRNYYDSTDDHQMKNLVQDARKLLLQSEHPSVAKLPFYNAALNATSALLLTLGFIAIRAKKKKVHQFFMGSAFIISIVFLVSYLTYHRYAGSVAFQGEGWLRGLYFAILISHTILAGLVPFLAMRTIFLARQGRFEAHKRWARWTLPIWMYVSATGVLVYAMLYEVRW